MPLRLIRHLDTRERELRNYPALLKDAPLMLDRAETAFRGYHRIRDRIFDLASSLLESKGMIAGMGLAAAPIRSAQEAIKNEIKDEKLDPALGKYGVQALGRSAALLKDTIGTRKEEYQTVVGKVDALYWAACQALDDVQSTIAQSDPARFEDDAEDGPGHNTRATANGSHAASVDLPKKNGARRTSGAKAPTRKRAARKARSKSSPREAN